MSWNPLRRARGQEIELAQAGGVEAVLDHYRSLTHERSTSHNRKSLAGAYINQTTSGAKAPGGGRL